MALIVEDGSGVADAESLASVAFADAYHEARGNGAWAALTTEVKEQLLRKATDYIVGTYFNAWSGALVNANQALPFPRIVGGSNVGVPLSIKQGTAELALIARSTSLTPVVKRGKKKVKVGPLEVEYDGNAPTATLFTAVSLRFGPWLNAPGNSAMVRLIRT